MIELSNFLTECFTLFLYYSGRLYIELIYQLGKTSDKVYSSFKSLTQEVYFQNNNIVVVFKNDKQKIKCETISEKLLKNGLKYDTLFFLKKTYINNKPYYERFDNSQDLLENNLEITEQHICKPFIVVSISINDENTIDINDQASKFFINSNVIFDKIFMIWFMSEFYNLDITNLNYKLNIVDYTIKTNSITDNQAIVVDKNSYTVKTI